MLVLSRRLHETVCIGDNILVTICHIQGKRVRLAIDAPIEVNIRRRELDSSDSQCRAEAIPVYHPEGC